MSPRGTRFSCLGAEAHHEVQQFPPPLDWPRDAGLDLPARERRRAPPLPEAPVQPLLQTAEEAVNATANGSAGPPYEPHPRRRYCVGATPVVQAAQSLGCRLAIATMRPLPNAQAPRSRNFINHRLHSCGDNDSGHHLGWGRSSGGIPERRIPTQRSHPQGLAKAKGGRETKMPTKNQWFHQVLFGEYRLHSKPTFPSGLASLPLHKMHGSRHSKRRRRIRHLSQ